MDDDHECNGWYSYETEPGMQVIWHVVDNAKTRANYMRLLEMLFGPRDDRRASRRTPAPS